MNSAGIIVLTIFSVLVAQVENAALKQQMEALKHDLSGRNQRLSLELQQHNDNYDHDRTKLVAQADQLTLDLDSARQKVQWLRYWSWKWIYPV